MGDIGLRDCQRAGLEVRHDDAVADGPVRAERVSGEGVVGLRLDGASSSQGNVWQWRPRATAASPRTRRTGAATFASPWTAARARTRRGHTTASGRGR